MIFNPFQQSSLLSHTIQRRLDEMEFKNLPIRPAGHTPNAYDSDMDSEWIQTPPEEAFADEDEFQIDPTGDLLLHVGSDPSTGSARSFRVCSNTLRRASPFWKRTLLETSSETQAVDEEWCRWTPSLYACQHEKLDGLMILLNVIHSKFSLIPKEPTLIEVYHTLCLASLYEMEHVLQPWIVQWSGVLKTPESTSDGRNLAMLSCIAWALGDERLFARTIIKISLTCTIDDRGHMITPDGARIEDYFHDSLGSPIIPEAIRTLRSQLATELPSHLNGVINRLIDGTWLCAGISGIPVTRNKKCDYIVLGSVFAGLIYVRGTRMTEMVIRVDESVMDLLKSLKRVLSYVTCYEKHPECNPAERIADAMKKTIDDMGTPLSSDCVQRMREQRQKTGWEN
ncbi:hypothetical protein CORC01_10845 [Colletotrichum orchidophilum]|uniref:Nuclear pore protein n=1 Tax=Colletotrichum orchidophilum TaxID=1209926 RepID=A0A1G4AXF5_9PEZI|nr:uncharacterized protein CORC01_10845 [Colletotrichum orchidophilum]OHE93824.1 hypothetical protein CORC01_10845 [Colletotrichum orchidophilum]